MGSETVPLQFPFALTYDRFRRFTTELTTIGDCAINALEVVGAVNHMCANNLRHFKDGVYNYITVQILRLATRDPRITAVSWPEMDELVKAPDIDAIKTEIKRKCRPGHTIYTSYAGHATVVGVTLEGKVYNIDPQLYSDPAGLLEDELNPNFKDTSQWKYIAVKTGGDPSPSVFTESSSWPVGTHMTLTRQGESIVKDIKLPAKSFLFSFLDLDYIHVVPVQGMVYKGELPLSDLDKAIDRIMINTLNVLQLIGVMSPYCAMVAAHMLTTAFIAPELGVSKWAAYGVDAPVPKKIKSLLGVYINLLMASLFHDTVLRSGVVHAEPQFVQISPDRSGSVFSQLDDVRQAVEARNTPVFTLLFESESSDPDSDESVMGDYPTAQTKSKFVKLVSGTRLDLIGRVPDDDTWYELTVADSGCVRLSPWVGPRFPYLFRLVNDHDVKRGIIWDCTIPLPDESTKHQS